MMSEESERRVLEDLENNIPTDYCRSCDSPDGLYHEWVDEDSWQYRIKMLLEEKDKEIEFHKNNEQIAIDCQNKLNEKIERLNNIINELENIIDIEMNEMGYAKYDSCLILMKMKIKEIKGDGVNEN